MCFLLDKLHFFWGYFQGFPKLELYRKMPSDRPCGSPRQKGSGRGRGYLAFNESNSAPCGHHSDLTERFGDGPCSGLNMSTIPPGVQV